MHRYRCCLDIISLLAAIRSYTSLGRRPYAVKMTETTLSGIHEAGHRPHVRYIHRPTQLPPVRACRPSVRLSGHSYHDGQVQTMHFRVKNLLEYIENLYYKELLSDKKRFGKILKKMEYRE